jgi:hypothetical protein
MRTTQIAVISGLALSGLSGTAVAEEVLFPTEPPLADSGWTVRYNELLVACYQGNMDACDRVVSDPGMISDTPIYNWAATCGGRLNIVAARGGSPALITCQGAIDRSALGAPVQRCPCLEWPRLLRPLSSRGHFVWCACRP